MNKLQWITQIFVLGLILATSPHLYAQNNSALELQEGLKLLREERFEPAVRKFSDILRGEPNNFEARLGLSIALIGVDKFAEATREIAKLLAHSPNDKRLLEMAAQTFLQQKRYIEAEKVLKRRLDLGDETAELWALYADSLDAQKKTIQAVSAYEKAVRLSPDSINFQYALGSLYWKQVRYDDAERVFLDILRRQPNEPRASFNLGDIYLTKGEAARSIPYLETASKSFSDEYDTHLALGRAYLATNAYDKAIEQLEIAVKLRPEIPEGFYQLGLALQKSGRREDAKVAFKNAQVLQDTKRASERIPQRIN